MPLDSLGLGLTLDTTLLEKADKTLENMHKNSKLVMQNLTRGITAFNEGKISDFSRVFDEMAKSMDKLSKTTVSPDFDTKGLEKGIGYVTELTAEIEKMQRAGTKEFFNPENLYTTTKSLTEATLLLKYFREEAKKVGDAIKTFLFNPIQISEAENNIKALKASLKGLSTDDDAYAETTIALKEEEDRLKDLEKELEAAKKAYGDLDSARLKSKEIIEQTAKAEQLVSWSSKTKAEQLAAITSYNNKIIADERARTKEVETLYKNNFAEMQRISKSIAQLEADREKIAKGGGDTTEQDINLAFYRDQLQKRIELEEEIAKSGYQKIAKIKEELDAKSFLNTSKQQVKNLQTEVAFANQFSKNAKNVEEEKQAIELLRSARNNLSKDTAHYSQIVEALNKRILSHKDHIEAITREEKEQNTLSDSVINRYRKQLKALDDIDEALDKLAKKRKKTGVASGEDIANEKALKARRATIEKDILEIEKQAQGQLDVIREQHDAERAKKSVEETIRQNEREKQEYAKLLDDLHAIKKQKQSLEEYGGKNTKEYANLEAQEQKYQQRITAIRRNHMYDRAEIEEDHNKKVNDEAVREFIAAEKEKQRIAEETQKKIDAYNEKYGTTSKRNAEMAITSYSGAQNINQHKQAIEGLQQVRARLDNTDKDYYETLKKLNREIHSHELFIRAAENESVRLGNSHRGLMDISGQLMRRLALVFSVSQMTQYFRKLVEVRGQFEKTEVALTSIVGSQEKSNKLMNQTIALAIKSPFTLQQLTGYTKQLAAYQVAYEQLHDTTKMLADVSAGLGVEMDRLILAFGQVKAANYLRATEVRQFTEAGFNILGELAKYYSELEGTMVSVGDVQERVTKRMVDFADVEEIFHRVTEAGGMFYEMQSKQAETLAGQWTNLQDRIDVMLNEIGTDKENILKFFVKFLASAIDNWEVLASSIKTAAAAFLIFKTYSLLAGDGIKLLAIQMGVLTDSVPKVLSLGQAFNTLGRVVKSAVTKIGTSMSALLTNPIFLAIAAIGALIGAGFSLYRHFDKVKDALKEQSDSFNEYTSSLNKLSKEYNKLDKFTEKLAKLEELKSRLNERGLNLSVKIDEVNTDNIDEIFTENSEILQKSYDLGLSVGNAITRGINAAQGNIFGWSLFGENLAEDAEDFAGKWNKLASYGMDAQMTAMTNEIEATIAAMNDMTEEEKSAYAEMLKIYEEIKDGRKAEKDDKGKIIKYLESEYEWTIRRATALKEIQDLEDGSVTKNNKLARYLRQVARQEKELNHEVENTVNKLAKEFDGLENLMQAAKDNPVEFSAAIQAEVDKQAWDEVTKWVYSQKLHARLDITPNYVEDPNATADKVYKGFKKDLMDARSKLSKITDKDGQSLNYQNFFISTDEIDNMKAFSDGLEGIQKLYNENKKTIEQLDGTSSSYNKEELDRLNALQNALKEVAKKWGYDLDLNAKGGESEALKKLKDQIKLIKEANKAYEERNKKFGKTDSQAVVTDAYKDAFKEVELAIEDIDYTNLEGVVKALENLEDEAKKTGGKVELLKAISEVKAEIGLTLKERQDRELFDQVQEIFDDYELAVDIKKLNIPTDLAKKLFGVEPKSFDQMRAEIISKFAGTDKEVRAILSKGAVLSAKDETKLINTIGKTRVDEAVKALNQIDDLEEKQQLESAKRFVKFLTKNLDQTKVIMSQRGIDITFAKEQFDKGEISAEQFAETVKNIVAQSNEEISKFNLDKFKESAEYIQAMGNLASYSKKEIQALIKTLNDAVTQNAHLFDADEVRAYMDALKKAQEELESRDVFEWGDFGRAADIIQTQKEIEDKKADIETNKAELETQKQKLAELQAKLDNLKAQQKATQDAGGDTAQVDADIAKTTSDIVTANEEIGKTNNEIKTNTGLLSLLGDKMKGLAGNMGSTLAIIDAIVHGINDTVQGINTIYGEIGSVMESFGKETDFSTGFGKGAMLMDTFAKSSQAAADGWDAFKNGDPVGVVVNVVKSITEIIKGINAYHDAGLEVSIQDHLGEVERLQKEYEKLEWVIGRAFAFDKYGMVAEQTKNIGKQIENTSKAIALEEDKKDTDEERIKELRENAEDARRQIHELYDNLREEIVGSYEDLSSTLADAMIEALKNGEDALKAWGDEVDNIIANIVTKLAVQKYVEPQVSRVLDQFYNKVMPKNAAAEKAFTRLQSMTVGTKEYENALAEWEKLNSEAIGELPQLTESSVNALKESLNAVGVSFEPIAEQIAGIFGGQGGGLSALQKGIQGVTEQTAQVLEALLNSMRDTQANSYSELRSQTNLLRDIKGILNDLTSNSPQAVSVKFA